MESKLNLDLNSLRVLVAIHDHRSVSAAALELNFSQSGLSTALARLRTQFGDALFTKTANGMEPTARARMLVEPARRIIQEIEVSLLAPPDFEPATSERAFVIAMSDIGEGIYMPEAVRSLYQLGSAITLRSVHMPPRQLEDAMANGEVDLAAGYFPDITNNQFHMRRIGRHSFTCIARAGHPVAYDRLTAEQFCELGPVVVEPQGRSQEVFEQYLKEHRIRRRVVLRVPHFMSVPQIISETDAIAVVPQALGDFLEGNRTVVQIAMPFMPPVFQANLYWHRSAQKDPGNLWLRSVLIEQFPRIRARRYDRNGVAERHVAHDTPAPAHAADEFEASAGASAFEFAIERENSDE